MDAASYEAFRTLMDRALDALRRGTDPRRREGVRVVTIVDIPPSGSPRSYEVIRKRATQGRERHLAARTTWRRDLDVASLSTNEARTSPTLESEELPIDEDAIAATLRRLATVHVPLSIDAEADAQTNRATREVHLSGNRVGTTFRWWGDPPPEWRGLADWADALVTLLERGA